MKEKIKVLMVDDEEQFRETTAKILKKRGFVTTMAADGEEAVAAIKSAPHDVVVLDIRMPGIDGHEALSQILEIRPGTRVIMLTGHGGEESAKKALEQGAFDYLSKPCDMDILSLKILDAYKSGAGKQEKRTEKTARDIMIHIDDYTTITEDKSVKDAIEQLMRSFEGFISTSRVMETGHRSILVFDDKGELTGLLAIQDLLAASRPPYITAPKPSMADSMQYSTLFWSGLFTGRVKEIGKMKVAEIMSESPPAADEGANLMELADRMVSEKIRRIVVTARGKVIGVVREQELFFEMCNILL